MTKSYRVTPRAEQDLDLIADYTIKEWGENRLRIYLEQIIEQFEWLSENPLAGSVRDDIHPDYRSFLVGRHLIFYIITDDTIDIIGVPHSSRDIRNYF